MSSADQKMVPDYDSPEYHITPMQQAAASCTGALLTSLLVTPLDVVKIRLQAQQKSPDVKFRKCFLYCNGLMDHFCSCSPPNSNFEWYDRPGHFKGTLDAFIKITRYEGVTSLWSGLSPTLVLAVPATIIYFVTYEQLRLKLKNYYNRGRERGSHVQPFWIPLAAGSSARTFSVTIVSPLELVRTKMQSRKLSYLEIGIALRTLVKTNGVFGLWKGLLPTLMRDVPFSAVYWMNYETMKRILGTEGHTPTFGVSFVSGAVSGGIAAAVTVPFDVVKTQQQIELGEKTIYTDNPKKTQTTYEIFLRIYRQNGLRGLFAGLVPRLIKVAPACAIMISSFEYGKIFFYRYNEERSIRGEDYGEMIDYYHDDYFPIEPS